MDKRTFMKELEQSLSVLQEDELKDILSEYEQHVDMKVKSGLTEEEAIADFGNLSELAAEILEAYHVSAKGACKNVGEKLAAGAKGAGGWIWGVICFWVRQLGRPFHWGAAVLRRGIDRYKDRKGNFEDILPEEELLGGEDRDVKLLTGGCSSDDTSYVETDGSAAAKNGRVWIQTRGKKNGNSENAGNGLKGAVGMLLRRIVGLAAGGLRLAVKAAFWTMRLIWNACCVGFALLCGILGVFCLFGFGMFVVLLLQRYPLAGVTVGCFGMMVCTFSAAWLGMTFLWRKNKRTDDGTDREDRPLEQGKFHKGKEEQYA